VACPLPTTDNIFYAGTGMLLCRSEEKVRGWAGWGGAAGGGAGWMRAEGGGRGDSLALCVPAVLPCLASACLTPAMLRPSFVLPPSPSSLSPLPAGGAV
jgi:hypothetical protein